MKSSNRMQLATVAMTAVFAIGTAAFAHEAEKKPMPEANHAMAGHSAGSMELHQIMTAGQKMPMPMSGDVDKDFATMMTMHHQQAIKMSDVLLKHGKSPELKALAAKMKAAQIEDIQKMAPFTAKPAK